MLRENNIDIGIICTTKENAQEVGGPSVLCGALKGIWNFALLIFEVPSHVALEKRAASESLPFTGISYQQRVRSTKGNQRNQRKNATSAPNGARNAKKRGNLPFTRYRIPQENKRQEWFAYI